MKRQDYYPSLLAEQIEWLRHFATQLPTHAPALPLTDAQRDDAVADALWLVYVLGDWRTTARRAALAITAALEDAQTGAGRDPLVLPVLAAPQWPEGVTARAPGALARIFKLVRTIKAARGYTQAIGAGLGLLTRMDTREHPAPTFTLSVKGGASGQSVVVRADKWGHACIYAESRRGGEDWQKVALFAGKTWEDKRPLLAPGQPEQRDYRLRFWDDEAPTGEWSAVVTITVSP